MVGVVSDRFRHRLVDRLVEAREIIDIGADEGRAAVVRTQAGYRITEAGSVALKAKVPADYDKKR